MGPRIVGVTRLCICAHTVDIGERPQSYKANDYLMFEFTLRVLKMHHSSHDNRGCRKWYSLCVFCCFNLLRLAPWKIVVNGSVYS